MKNQKQLPNRRTYSLRLREQERSVLERAALSRGQTLSEYIRQVATTAARAEIAQSA